MREREKRRQRTSAATLPGQIACSPHTFVCADGRTEADGCESHTHTRTLSTRSRTVLFVSTYQWNRLSIEASSHVWRSFWENHTPESHGPDPLTVQLWFVCMRVFVTTPPLELTPGSVLYTLNTSELVNICQNASGNRERAEDTMWEWRWCCRLFHSNAVARIFTQHNIQGENYWFYSGPS